MENEEIRDRIIGIEREGCQVGKVHGEQIKNLCDSITRLENLANGMAEKFDKTMKSIDNKWMIGMGLILLVSFLAGINVGDILKSWVTHGGLP